MKIQTTPRFQTQRNQPQPPQKDDPKPPQDPQDHPWREATVAVGRSTLRGAIEGMGNAYLAQFARTVGGPGVGVGVSLALMGLAAAGGVRQDGERIGKQLDSPLLGKVVAGAVEAGKVAMYTAPTGSFNGALIQGAAFGGLFGLLETPR